MDVGRRVRLKHDPTRIGVLTGRTMERRAGLRLQVMFPDGYQYVPERELELLPDAPEPPDVDLGRGRLGAAEDLRRALTSVRLSGRLADVIYSMDTTGTDFYAYQFKPIVKLLNSASSGLLIADEVGLGKTIEAGLIWTELRSRYNFRRLLVACPAMLREKWQRELYQRFGVKADILDARGTLNALQRAEEEGRSSQFAIIGSLQGLRPRRGWQGDSPVKKDAASELARYMFDRQERDAFIDLTIVDEAHYMRNASTMTASLGRLLRAASDHMVLLSATPVHLKSQDLFQLLNLVDEDAFDRADAFDDVLEANAPLVRARERVLSGSTDVAALRADLDEANGHALLQGSRQLRRLLEQVTPDLDLSDRRTASELAFSLEKVNLLGHVVTRTRKRSVTEWRVTRVASAEEVRLTEPERAFYDAVTETVRSYCLDREAHEGFLLATPQRQMSSSMPAALRFWTARGVTKDVELFEDMGSRNGEPTRGAPGPLVQEIAASVGALGSYEELRAVDSKYRLLKERLTAFLGEHPTEKLVLFSYFRATLAYLEERLREDGIACLVLKGGVDDKTAVVDRFRTHEGQMVLLSSEVGSEGIDLQFAWVVINYDLPWNPMRVEQRIGRLDRLGQTSDKVVIWNLFYENTIDSRIYHRLYARLELFERTLGGMEPILGEKIQDLAIDLLSKRLSPAEEERRIVQTELALEAIRKHEEELEGSAAQLVAYGDYILNQIHAARELNRRITAADLQAYVMDFFGLHYVGSEFGAVGCDESLFDVRLSMDAKRDLEAFLRRERLDALTRAAEPGFRAVRVRFENTVVPQVARDIETLSQHHPLVRFVTRRLDELNERTRPAVAIRLPREQRPDSVAPGLHAFAVQRWAFRGLQELERLHFSAIAVEPAAGPLPAEAAERLVAIAAGEGNAWPEAAGWFHDHPTLSLQLVAEQVRDQCLDLADAEYQTWLDGLRAQNADRADIQERTLEKLTRRQMEVLGQVLARHQRLQRAGLTAATEGRIRALQERSKRQQLDIDGRRETGQESDDVCTGVILVE